MHYYINYLCMQGLLGGIASLPDEPNVRVLALFDNEEVAVCMSLYLFTLKF